MIKLTILKTAVDEECIAFQMEFLFLLSDICYVQIDRCMALVNYGLGGRGVNKQLYSTDNFTTKCSYTKQVH